MGRQPSERVIDQSRLIVWDSLLTVLLGAEAISAPSNTVTSLYHLELREGAASWLCECYRAD